MMEQLLAHLVGDYLFQSDWMAQNKRSSWLAAWWHAWFYTVPFIFIPHLTGNGMLFIFVSHLLIDRFGLARYVVYAKNFIAPSSEWPTWETCRVTGYPDSRPAWLTVWPLIIADNTIHLLCNYAALRWL